MEGLLDGIVVLDLGRVLACPYAATMMADMGATVIKIENPKGGDDTRKMGPFVNGNSVYYANFNRGKVGVTLNLKEPEGKEIFKEMVKKADVVLENYRPGTMEKLGLGYDVLKEVNPGIIYGSISGFGHTGPLSKRAGYDIVGQAMGGLMSTTGWPDGPATRTGTPMGDVLGALNMTVGVLAALVNKQRTGKGEKVDAENASLLINFCFPAERVPINGYISLLPHCLYLIILRCDRGHAHPDQPVLAIRAAFPLTAERFKCGNHAVVADFRLNREPLPIIVVLDLTDGNVIFDGGLGVCPLVVQPFGQTLEGSANIGNFHGLLLYHS